MSDTIAHDPVGAARIPPLSTRDLLQELARNRLLEGVPNVALAQVGAAFGEVMVDSEAVITEEGEESKRVYFIMDGTIRISRATAGKQHTIAYLASGEFFGEIEFFSSLSEVDAHVGGASSARATAAVPTHLAFLDWPSFATLVRAAPLEIVRNVMRSTGERYRAANDQRVAEILRSERLSLIGQMAGTIVHDLKNPVGVVRNIASLLEEDAGLLPASRMAGMLHRSADQMLGMIQDLLDFSRGTSSVRLAPITVTALMADLDEQVLRQLPAGEIAVVRDLEFTGEFNADQDSFLRVLVNLINNAVEAMGVSGTLTISCRREQAAVVFTVSDTGPGIPPELQARIFEPFVTHGKAKGTGLGLAITKAIVEAHHGRIDVSSAAGAGTTFRIILPSSPPAAQ